MSDVPLEPERPVPLLSRRPPDLFRAMIRVASPPKSLNPPRSDRVSSVGVIDRLPPEIIHMVLGMLDVKSIISFARVSSRGTGLVQSLPAYRQLTALAPQALVALGRLGLLGLHPISELYAALRSEQCASCPEYGAFLFLPTCERCCWECPRSNPSLRVILPKEAKRYFGLSEPHLRQLPTIHVIPGNYGVSGNPAPAHCKPVSVRAAGELRLRVHGSEEELAEALTRRFKSPQLLVKGRYLQGRPSAPQG